MNIVRSRIAARCAALVMSVAIVALPIATLAQTKIAYHSNKYSVQDDVKLGRQAATQAEQQFPLLRDSRVSTYVESVGQRLVAAIPAEFQHPEFRYSFRVINASDINAFALPGGPMYVNRGMIQSARTEGEMAGVMAHEISHVALRHGTAQATKAQKYSLGAGIAGILGTILAGPTVGQAAQMPFVVSFLRFSREYETEADLLGARIMANAGYDPRELANMFQTIERQGGGGGGGWFSDHPSPSNRYARINQEAQYLRVNNYQRDNREFLAVNERLRGYPRAQTMAEIQRSGNRYPNQGDGYPTGDRTNYPTLPGRVEPPSSRYQSYAASSLFRVSVPENWRQVSNDSSSMWFAPQGAYGTANGQPVFTHGVNFGVFQPSSRNLEQASNEFLSGLQRENGNLRARGSFTSTTLAGRHALAIALNNVNEATGRAEIVQVVTTRLRNGQVFYMIGVAPNNEYSDYQRVFSNILRSVQLND